MPKVPMRLLPLLCAMLVLQACVQGGPIVATPGACSALIPDSWRLGVAGAELPEGNVIADWIAFADAQTGRLDDANGRLADAMHIIGGCERRAAQAVERSRPKVLGIF